MGNPASQRAIPPSVNSRRNKLQNALARTPPRSLLTLLLASLLGEGEEQGKEEQGKKEEQGDDKKKKHRRKKKGDATNDGISLNIDDIVDEVDESEEELEVIHLPGEPLDVRPSERATL